MQLIELERNARVLKVGTLRVLFSYADPVAFVDARGAVQRSASSVSMATRAQLRGCGPGEYTIKIRDAAVGNPRLGAGEDVLVSFATCHACERRNVRARIRFRQCKSPN